MGLNIALTQPLAAETSWPTGPELLVALDVLLVLADAIMIRVMW